LGSNRKSAPTETRRRTGTPRRRNALPHASTTRRDAAAAAASDFEIRENARLALELKQEELEKLKRRLSATEDALRRREDRNAELETRLSEHEGNKVAAEAEALNSSLAAAMRDVRGFFSSGGKVDAAKTPSFNGNGEASATFDKARPRERTPACFDRA
jgi:chromosome segregation ATPase